MALVLLSVTLAQGASVSDLIRRLEKGEDFRVRVQAALELGKTKSSAARKPLEGALDDENAAVRAAAAAALKALGDKRAISALSRHKKDPSAAVRAQIKSTIAALQKADEAQEDKPRIIVKLGKMKDRAGVRSRTVMGELEQTARQKFEELPGIAVVDESSSTDKGLPVVMVTGHVRKVKITKEGDGFVYSASVEYIVHRMPAQSIAGTVSGSASTTASSSEARDRKRSAELQRAVLSAAVASAVRRAPEALAAAAR